MQIRSALPSDSSAIALVHVRSWQVAYRGLIPDAVLDGLDVERDAKVRAWLIEQPGWDVLVADVGFVVGFCDLAPTRDADGEPSRIGEITAIYVQPDQWRRGCGRALLDAAITAARKRGFVELTLWVLQENQRARRFYEAAGLHYDGGERLDTDVAGFPVLVRYRVSLVAAEPA